MADALTPLPSTDLDQLRRSSAARSSPGRRGAYDEARRLWNAIHDRRPAVIVRPTDADEVATAIRLRARRDLEIAVRSGGHSPPGHRGRRRRPRDRPVRDARRRGGPGGADRPSERRRAPRRARRRRAGARPGLPGRRRRPHGRRRADAGWRRRPAAAAVRPHDRQPCRGRARHGRRPAACARARPRSRSCSGAFAARAGTSGS